MRVAFVTTSGINPLFKNWPEYILGRYLVARGHEVTIYRYEPIGSPRRETIDGIAVRQVERGRFGFTPSLGLLLRDEPKPDIVNIFHIRNLLAYQAGLAFRKMGVPLVHTPIGPLHDDYLVADRDAPLAAPPRYDNPIYSAPQLARRLIRERRPRRTARNYLIHAPLRWADRLIAISNHERETLIAMGLPARKIATIPLWIDVAHAATLPQEPADLGLPHPILLYVGQLKFRKGFDLLAQAMPRVRERYPTASFVFVGHSPRQQADLEAIARQNGTTEALHLLGRPDPAELQRLYRAADALVFPSRYEGFGLPPLEAMAAGCPVITTDVPVVNESVDDGVNGLLAPPNDPAALAATILRLLDDPALRERLIVGGHRILAERFNGDILAERVIKLYEGVVSRES
jgi:glycosyltransferase involved in cell wall biosynthesis